jgi:sugar phosphate permease
MTTLTQTPGKSTNGVDWSKWIRFALLVMAGGTIYKLANLKDAFYVPMQEAMGLSHTEIGTLLSVNSMVATALFIVGGYLADRFSTRILIPLGLVGTGALGLFLSTFPGFSTLLLLFALLAVCSDCLVWPALLKSIRQLGGSKEQGFLEVLDSAGQPPSEAWMAPKIYREKRLKLLRRQPGASRGQVKLSVRNII